MNRPLAATIGLIAAFLNFLSGVSSATRGAPGGGALNFIAAGLFLFGSLAILAVPRQDEKPSCPQGDDSNHRSTPT
jgi:hypothetical protein